MDDKTAIEILRDIQLNHASLRLIGDSERASFAHAIQAIEALVNARAKIADLRRHADVAAMLSGGAVTARMYENEADSIAAAIGDKT